ncbi:phosphate ABC transporter substrate-binding protein [Garciella nitratireducens]|uniref:Phosphate-binding protein n=1 Tax=Garciella nitratireducens DSM 15102 TaxID=1121911 RepID=A0A1T4K0K5_9FIRM|nr:phosphate ABC transporter substrate-binding protein [Garciella nitratireducens]SJZ35943.1 phosphate ABC transporter substrate-binding protein, PhoT family [Garciella nitratireducens DSM 15102]
MKKLYRKGILILTLLLSLFLVFVGCSTKEVTKKSNGEESESTTKEIMGKDLEGTITLIGSTSVTPIAQVIGDSFMKEYPNVKIEVQGVGSSAGIKATNDGLADIGMSSRDLKEEEKELGIKENIIAYDGIAVVVHPNNKINNLTQEQIGKIFKGEITNWNEVGGKDEKIDVISREEGSGTRSAFEELMGLESEKGSLVRQDATFADGNGAIVSNVAQKENAIGYISLSYLNDTVKALTIDGVEPTIENIKSGDYAVSRPFLMLTKGKVSDIAQAYLDYVLSEKGQKIVEENGVISID